MKINDYKVQQKCNYIKRIKVKNNNMRGID